MIQRIQSIFLLLAAISFGLLFKFPFASQSAEEAGIFSDGLLNVFDHPIMLVLTGLGMVASIGAIFLFNNRPLQKRITFLVIVLAILVPLISFLLMLNQGAAISTDSIAANDEPGLYIPIIGVVCAALAVRFINKDEKLVKSMDRLR